METLSPVFDDSEADKPVKKRLLFEQQTDVTLAAQNSEEPV